MFPEWEDLNPENKIENAAEAMKRAEEWLGVPQVRPFAIMNTEGQTSTKQIQC